MENLAASLPTPTPLRLALRVDYWWGGHRYEILAIAAAVRTTSWPADGVGPRPSGWRRLLRAILKLFRPGAVRAVTWLHCHATQVSALQPDGGGPALSLLIPAAYVTRAEPGPTFRRRGPTSARPDLGIFPPDQPAPAGALPASELERVIAGLMDPTMN